MRDTNREASHTGAVPGPSGVRGKGPGPVLVLAENSALSSGALHMAELLARRDGVNAHVVGVVRPVEFPVWAFVDIDSAAMEEGRREAFLDAMRVRVHGTVGLSGYFTVEAATGSPASILAEAAHRRGSACILAGLGDHGSAERPPSEDAILQLMETSPVPVVAVPPGFTHLPTRALVAMDFSAVSHRAAAAALALVDAGATVTLAHVAPEADLRAMGAEGLAAIYEQGVAGLFQQLEASLGTRGRARVDSVLLKGEPAPAILHLAASGAYDLIACGTHGSAAAGRRFPGSVSTALLRGARCPVLIAPAG